jgi:hypothetical protein
LFAVYIADNFLECSEVWRTPSTPGVPDFNLGEWCAALDSHSKCGDDDAIFLTFQELIEWQEIGIEQFVSSR